MASGQNTIADYFCSAAGLLRMRIAAPTSAAFFVLRESISTLPLSKSFRTMLHNHSTHINHLSLPLFPVIIIRALHHCCSWQCSPERISPGIKLPCTSSSRSSSRCFHHLSFSHLHFRRHLSSFSFFRFRYYQLTSTVRQSRRHFRCLCHLCFRRCLRLTSTIRERGNLQVFTQRASPT